MDGDKKATFDLQSGEDGRTDLVLKGRLDRDAVAAIWRDSTQRVRQVGAERLVVQAGELDYCDGAGIALLLEFKRIQRKRGKRFEIENLQPRFRQLLTLFETYRYISFPKGLGGISELVHNLGGAVVHVAHDFFDQVSFTGEVFAKLLKVLVRPGGLRWRPSYRRAGPARFAAPPPPR